MEKLPSWLRARLDAAWPCAQNMLGNYFRFGTPTPGTGIAMGIQTTFSDTANVLLLLYNGGLKRFVMDFLKLICTAAGSTTTSAHVAVKIDNKDRYTSGGSDLTPLARPDGGVQPSTITKCRFGIITANAVWDPRIVGRDALKVVAAPCWAVNDQVTMSFGVMGQQAGGIAAATAGKIPIALAPAIIRPGWSLLVHLWNIANATTAPSWELEGGGWELD
jgi:hypothetical protein